MAPFNTMTGALTIAAKTASVDIPKPRHGGRLGPGGNSFAAVAARSLPMEVPPPLLPTPPNSISPSLPPQGFRARGDPSSRRPPSPHPVDSELDLRKMADLVEMDEDAEPPWQSPSAGLHQLALADLDAAGAITPVLLAKHHLPDILLAHGPLAIRHVMSYLTTSVPGFSRIAPAKSRRLVVAALEGRGSGVPSGGRDGDVEFEKVGWGRWEARRRGASGRADRPPRADAFGGVQLTPPPYLPSPPTALPTRALGHPAVAHRPGPLPLGASWTDGSAVVSHDEAPECMEHEDTTMLDYEADKMSLDERSCSSSSEAMEEEATADDDPDDVTDDEDWAGMGAAALRQAYAPGKGPGRGRVLGHAPLERRATRRVEAAPSAGLHSATGLAVGSDPQERDAIEALVRLGSV
ncbi:MAG: DNA-binding proteins Bright/BRCAA1/RBP1 and proteins containing BRIGHT domain [Phylliscum demangeonii]|nr:MAG: DNA-binding proteins Bright/BRCAA1/RBP1 and proteins containing BRIGHT domain [Phylliscum demangeonii]